jgi:hypothetical protein
MRRMEKHGTISQSVAFRPWRSWIAVFPPAVGQVRHPDRVVLAQCEVQCHSVPPEKIRKCHVRCSLRCSPAAFSYPATELPRASNQPGRLPWQAEPRLIESFESMPKVAKKSPATKPRDMCFFNTVRSNRAWPRNQKAESRGGTASQVSGSLRRGLRPSKANARSARTRTARKGFLASEEPDIWHFGQNRRPKGLCN